MSLLVRTCQAHKGTLRTNEFILPKCPDRIFCKAQGNDFLCHMRLPTAKQH